MLKLQKFEKNFNSFIYTAYFTSELSSFIGENIFLNTEF